MVEEKRLRLSRDDWLKGALNQCKTGVENIKIAPLADDLGVTTGSFYWHFKNRRELLEALLDYWEREMTDSPIDATKRFSGSPTERIFFLMEIVMTGNLAGYDLPMWLWAQSDSVAATKFRRVLKKRLEFTTRLFVDAGFSGKHADVRARMAVIYMMGESTLIPESMARRKDFLEIKHAILTASV